MANKPFRTTQEIADRQAFIEGANKEPGKDIFTLSGISRLSEDEILDRIEEIDNQSTLLRWRLWYALRKKYPSDKLFGQRIADLKATRSICASGPAVINREMHAGKWCEENKVYDLNAIGILKSVIYILSAPANKDVAKQLFHEIKRKNLPIKEVNRKIEQARAVLTIEKQPEEQAPEVIDYDRPATEKQVIPVVNNVAKVPAMLEEIKMDIVTLLANQEPLEKTPEPASNYDDHFGRQYNAVLNHVEDVREMVTLADFSDEDLLLELSMRKAVHLSDKEIISELSIVCERYDEIKSFPEMADILKQIEKNFRKMGA